MSKTALVTGASRGIGREIALTLGAEGHTVIVNYSGSKDKANDVVKEIESNGGTAESYQCHVQNADDVKAMIKYITDTYGSIDIVVNNAGITRDNLLMRKSVSRPMVRQKSGSIVNISSIVGSLGNAGQTNYVATKAAIDGMTKSVARELASKNITVNGVAPGFIKSDMTDVLGDDIKDGMLQQIPLKHFGETKDIANAVSFLTSDKASYITGQIIHVNGGMYMG